MPVFNDYEFRVRCDRLYTPYELHEDYVVDIAGGRIRSVAPAAEAGDPSTKSVIHEAGTSVVPGFIDLHIHGSRGHDVMDGTRDSLATVSATLARHGTTSFLATTLSAPDSDTETAIRGFAAHGDRLYDGAAAIGLHLEGPFLNPVRRGTHNAAYLRAADGGAFRRWIELSGNRIRKITVAPEMDPSLELTRAATALGIQVSIGHSDATVEQARAAVDAGARHATHTFNAMRPLHQREPGIIGLVLTDERVYAEVIADGFHVHPAAVHLLWRAKGPERTLLITDALSALEMPDGRYPLGDQMIEVRGGECRNADGTIAGSTLTLDCAVQNLVRWFEVPLHLALAAATASPARSMNLGHTKGIIAPGCDADLVFLDGDLNVVRTMVAGRTVYRR